MTQFRWNLAQDKDILSALLFGALGLWFMIGSFSMPFGSPMSMGAGFFPRVVGGALAALALGILIVRLRRLQTGPVDPISIQVVRIAIACVAVTLFVFALRPLGLVIASFILLFISGMAVKGFKMREVLIVATLMSVAASYLFVAALGLQVSIWPRMF